jgi:hypothetical protein
MKVKNMSFKKNNLSCGAIMFIIMVLNCTIASIYGQQNQSIVSTDTSFSNILSTPIGQSQSYKWQDSIMEHVMTFSPSGIKHSEKEIKAKPNMRFLILHFKTNGPKVGDFIRNDYFVKDTRNKKYHPIGLSLDGGKSYYIIGELFPGATSYGKSYIETAICYELPLSDSIHSFNYKNQCSLIVKTDVERKDKIEVPDLSELLNLRPVAFLKFKDTRLDLIKVEVLNRISAFREDRSLRPPLGQKLAVISLQGRIKSELEIWNYDFSVFYLHDGAPQTRVADGVGTSLGSFGDLWSVPSWYGATSSSTEISSRQNILKLVFIIPEQTIEFFVCPTDVASATQTGECLRIRIKKN